MSGLRGRHRRGGLSGRATRLRAGDARGDVADGDAEFDEDEVRIERCDVEQRQIADDEKASEAGDERTEQGDDITGAEREGHTRP